VHHAQQLIDPAQVLLAELGRGIRSLRYPLPDGTYVIVLNKVLFKAKAKASLPRQRGAVSENSDSQGATP
jgi:hypothetical protein